LTNSAAAILTVSVGAVKCQAPELFVSRRDMIRRVVISSAVSHASAIVLFAGGLAWLFAPDVVFSRLGLAVPSQAAWVGQLLGAAWLGFGALNWVQRRAILGGVYGRPVVLSNLFHYFIGAMVLIKAGQSGAAVAVWLLAIPFAVLSVAYGALLFRGPFDT
jgi:hypothetical protein